MWLRAPHRSHNSVTKPALNTRTIRCIELRANTVLVAGPLHVRPNEMAMADGRTLHLPRRELQLLTAFIENANRVFSREKWAAEAWALRSEPGDRSVDYAVVKLRRRLRQALPDWEFIHTHVGVGYRFSAERSQGFHNTGTAG